MTTGAAMEAAAALPAIEEAEERWAEDVPEGAEGDGEQDEARVGVAGSDGDGRSSDTDQESGRAEADPDEQDGQVRKPGGERDEQEGRKEGRQEAETEEVRRKARAFDDLAASFSRDTVGYMRAMHEMLTPEQRAALGLKAPEPDAVGQDWEDAKLTPPERFVKQNAAFIRDLPRFANGVSRAVGTHEQALIQHDNTLAALTAQVDALSAALGVTLPKAQLHGIDMKAREAYEAETKAAGAKARAARAGAETAVPKTPRNGAGVPADPETDLTPRANESFTQLFRRVAAASRG